MVIYLTVAVIIAATRAAGGVGQLCQGPKALEGAPGLHGCSFLAASLAAASCRDIWESKT